MMARAKLNLSGLNKLKKKMAAISNVKVQVGHFDNETHPESEEGVSHATVSWLVNKGIKKPTGGWHSVPRPYLPIAFNVMAKENKVQLVSAMRLALTTKPTTLARNLRKLGAAASRTTKRVMRSARKFGIAPNTPRTIQMKRDSGSSYATYPTMDTGALRRNVKYRLVRGDRKLVGSPMGIK